MVAGQGRRGERKCRRRLADQHGDRVLEGGARDADVDRLRPRGFELRFRQRDVRLRREAARKTGSGQLERAHDAVTADSSSSRSRSRPRSVK